MPDFALSDNPRVAAVLAQLEKLSPGRDVLGLERISAIMARLGNPHHHLPPIFHVAGTNGKGSTCAFLRFALEAQGYLVHCFTSPHLVRFNERIRLAGRLIEDVLLADLLEEVLRVSADINPSFFEATTAAAFLAFSRTPADALVLEVGLGGRLDATNVVPTSLVCGIAQLGLDHQLFLGDDIVTIAGEKAGIARAGVPLVTLRYDDLLAARVAEVAAQAGAKLIACDTETLLPPLGLAGAFQQENAALARSMLRAQTLLPVNDATLAQGFAATRWPARMQKLAQGALIPTQGQFWLDGCHNPAAAAVVAATMRAQAPLHLICAVLENKDMHGIIAPFAGIATHLTALTIPHHACHSPQALMACAQSLGMEAMTAPDLPTAIAHTRETNTLIMGSLYLAAQVLTLNGEYPQ
jgi:dihydrofolate synthase / folylpolyglutamate synthase